MEIDVSIERIDNGYVVIGKDSSKSRIYYPSLEDFANSYILENLREIDKQIKEHEIPKKPFTFKLVSDL